MSKEHKEPGWLVANPVVSFALDIIPYGGPDNAGALVGVVLRQETYGREPHKAAGTFAERRVLQIDEVPEWIKSVLRAQADAEARVEAAQAEHRALAAALSKQRPEPGSLTE